jgi:hypothetical protein
MNSLFFPLRLERMKPPQLSRQLAYRMILPGFQCLIAFLAVTVVCAKVDSKPHGLLILKLRRSGSTWFTGLVSQQQGVW